MKPPWKIALRQKPTGWWQWSLCQQRWWGDYKTESVARGIAKRALTRLHGNGGTHDPANFEFIVLNTTEKQAT